MTASFAPRWFRSLNLPAALLVTLLQRAPALRVAVAAGEWVVASPVGTVLRSAAATLASLGALHSLAGASTVGPVVTQLVSDVDQPATATVGAPFSEQVFFYSSSVTIIAQSWTVTNTLPPGVTVQGGTLKGAGLTVNTANGTLVLSGTPTTAGTYTVTITGYQFANLTPPSTTAKATIIVTATTAAAAPAITQQPAGKSATVGGTVSFSVSYSGSPAPTVQWYKNGTAISGATSATLSLTPVSTGDAGDYTVTVTNPQGAVTSSIATLTVNPAPVPPMFTQFPAAQSVTVGATVTFTAGATGVPTPTLQWLKDGTAIPGATGASLTLTNVQLGDAGSYVVAATNSSGTLASATAVLTVNLPDPNAYRAGTTVPLTAAAGGAGATYQWQADGRDVPGATAATLTLSNLQPADAGLYDAVVTSPSGTTTGAATIVGLATTAKVLGAGQEVGSNIYVASNGNTFDQVLLQGAAATVTADYTLNQITRTSFIDLNDDIVQVEYSGPGTLSLLLDNPSGPALPVNYNQTTTYMKGHANIVITGADERSNLSVFSVGRVTAVNQALFKSDVTYNGIADLAFVAISTTNGKFGGVRTADAHYFAAKGLTGLYAPGVQFQGPVYLGNITAFDAATPVILLGAALGETRITGGDLLQDNLQPVQVSGITQLKFTAGSDSHGNLLPAQANRAVLKDNGVDVTAKIVVNPAP